MVTEFNVFNRLQLVTLVSALRIHLETQGKYRLTKLAKPSYLRNLAESWTGHRFPQSPKGMRSALQECEALLARVNEAFAKQSRSSKCADR